MKAKRRKTRPTCVSTAVTQGDSLSATLFNVVLNMTLDGTLGKTDIVQSLSKFVLMSKIEFCSVEIFRPCNK